LKPVPFLEAIRWAKTRKVVLPDEYYGERIGLARAQARTISGLAGVDQIQSVFDKLDDMQKSGGTFRDFQKAVAAGEVDVALPRHRLELIHRNNIQSSYMAGRWQQVQANKVNRPYLMYIAVNDGRTRPSHRAMHGHIARVDSSWWQTHHPLNGFRCRCGQRSLSEAEAKRRGIKPAPNAEPDKGWDYNPGMAPMEGLKQAAKQKKKVVHKKLAGAVDEAVPASYHSSMIERDVLKEWLKKPTGMVIIGNSPTYLASALGASTLEVTLSKETMDKQVSHHPELTMEEYMLIMDMINNGNAFREAKNKAVIIHSVNGKRYVVAIKSTRDGNALFVTSLFKISLDREVRRLQRKGEKLERL